MLRFLFPRLTPERQRCAALFAAVTKLARAPHWYVEGGVPDTIDGRFRVLATVAALVVVRVEDEGEEGTALSAALTERFIAVMESEHRELGLGDPSLGKKVRKLVGALARRVSLWRDAASSGWDAAAAQSLYGGDENATGVAHAAAALKSLADRLRARPLEAIAGGDL